MELGESGLNIWEPTYNIFVKFSDDGYVEDVVDDTGFQVEGYLLIDISNYYSFIGNQHKFCKLSSETKTTIEDGSVVTWHFLVLDEEKYIAEEQRLEEELLSQPTVQERIDSLKNEIEKLKDSIEQDENTPQQTMLNAFFRAPALMAMATPHVLDEEVEAVGDYIPLWRGEGTAYQKDEIVKYKDSFYRVIQPHTPQPHWPPDQGVSLYTLIGNPQEEYPNWIQPQGAHNAYQKGDKVKHKGKRWISLKDQNVWEPGGAGLYGLWEEVL